MTDIHAVYCRTSTEDQAERQTIENQVHFAKKYIDLHQLDVQDFYLDNGISGTIPLPEREEGQRLLEAAKEKKFNTLLVFKLDRLGRSARITLNTIYELEALGIKIKSMTEPFDTSTPAGRFMITMLAGVADLERDTILERMWHGANRAAREGKWLGGIVPYGYRVNADRFLEVNYDMMPNIFMSEYDIVRFIYEKIGNDRWSTVKVADHLNALGIPTSYTRDKREVQKDGKRKTSTAGIWSPTQISRIAKNETYKGIHKYGKRSKKEREIIERSVPAIVDADLWQKVQVQLYENKIESMKNKKYDYLLQGLIKCGSCGMTYIGSRYEGGKYKQAYYTCGGKKKYHGGADACDSKNIQVYFIEDMIWNECIRFIENPESAVAEIEKGLQKQKNQTEALNDEQEALRSSLSAKDNEKGNILDLYRKGLIQAVDVERQLQKIASEKETLEKRYLEIEIVKREAEEDFSAAQTANDFLTSLQEKSKCTDFASRRQIVKSLIEKIVIHTDSGVRKAASIEVQYRFSPKQNAGVTHTDKRAYNTCTNYNEKLFSIRKNLRLNVSDFAKLCNVSPETIYKAETGGDISLRIVKKIALATGVPIWLVGKYDQMPEETFAERLHKAMYYHGHTVKECAASIGIDPSTVLRYLHGDLPKKTYTKKMIEKYILILEGGQQNESSDLYESQ